MNEFMDWLASAVMARVEEVIELPFYEEEEEELFFQLVTSIVLELALGYLLECIHAEETPEPETEPED